MKTRQLPFAATHLPGVAAPPQVSADAELLRRLKARAAELPIEGNLPAFTGANAWLNSPPLTPAGLRGPVGARDFLALPRTNLLRTPPHLRGRGEKEGGQGLVAVGGHNPEVS